MRELLLLETNEGFVVHGLVPRLDDSGQWAESAGVIEKQTFTFADDDVSRFMDESYAQRRTSKASRAPTTDGFYEHALRVIGRYIDEQKPRDIFLFEQDHSFVLRLLMGGRSRRAARAGRVHARRGRTDDHQRGRASRALRLTDRHAR